MANTVNTRLVLRNDQLSNWNASIKPLLKGEAALAQLSGDLSNYFQLRIGVDGTKTWKDLEPSNILIPVNNVNGLTYSKYELRKVSVEGAYPIQYKLFGLKNKVLGGAEEWIAVSDTAIEIPEVDFGPINGKIDYLSNAVSTITETTLPAAKTELSAALSGYTDTRITELSGAADATIASVSAETLEEAAADATTKANAASAEALAEAKAYTNSVSAELSSDYQGQINQIKDEIAGGIHFIGHVVEFGVDETKDPKEGWYKLEESDTKTKAKNGDLIIHNSKEYIWSDKKLQWDEFGDEGNYATKDFVNAAALSAKNLAIEATQNTVTIYTDKTVAEFIAGKNVGDVAINKKTITGDKKEYTAYVWNGTTWEAMDGNYSADNVFMPENMIITEKFGKYTIPSSGSRELECAGMTVKAFINDAFAETKSGTKTTPTFELTVSGGTGEIGTKYTVPAATLKMTGVGSYQYGPATGITVPVNNAVIKATKSGYEQELSNSTAMALKSTISTTAGTANAETYLSGGATYTYTATANYTEGAVPKNNIGADDPGNKIPAGSFSDSKTATFTGQYPAYYAFTTTPKANPTALTANNGNVTVDGVTYTRELNVFNKTSFKTTAKWYELFYLVPQAKKNSSGWKGKDSNNVDLAVEAKTTATVTFLDGTTATYNVYVVRNAAQYGATTCTMTFI